MFTEPYDRSSTVLGTGDIAMSRMDTFPAFRISTLLGEMENKQVNKGNSKVKPDTVGLWSERVSLGK